MPTVHNGGRLLWGFGLAARAEEAMKPGTDFGCAGRSPFAGCVSWCVSNVCDLTRYLFESQERALAG